MSINVQDLNFTRYVYQNTFISHKHRNTFCNPHQMVRGDFDQFILSNTIRPFGIPIVRNNKLSLRITIEPFKHINSNSKGVLLYLQNEIPHNQDESGLRRTKYKNLFYGDFYKLNKTGAKCRDLIICELDPKDKLLIIDVYYGYYPTTNKERETIINNHLWHKKTTPKSGLKSFKTFQAINK